MEIAIIKLGAKGDVIRTLPIVREIKKKFGGRVSFFTKENVIGLVELSGLAEEIIISLSLSAKEFDKLYNFDIEEEATTMAEKLKAKEKYGFRREDGFLQTYNFGAEYYLNTLFDDEVKRSNKKTYQEMMFELAEIEASKDNFIINLGKFSNFGKIFVKKNNIEGKKIIGIHMGASLRWPSKIWHEDRLFEFVKKAKAKSYEIIIFGGPEEEEKQKEFVEKLDNVGVRVYRNNPKNSDLEFSSLVNVCDVMICSDSFSLHVSIALGKPTVGLFFCTPPNEVEDYGILRKIVSSRLYEFFPERMDEYDEELVKSINENDVLSLINEIFREKNL